MKVIRPDVGGITRQLAASGMSAAEIHEWFNTPHKDLVIAATPVTPKQWLAGGGSTRKIEAAARTAAILKEAASV